MPASDIQKQVLPISPNIHVYQDPSKVSFQAKYKHHTLLRIREKTETKGINTHPTKRKPDISTQNYNLPLPTCLDARINTESIIARTRGFHCSETLPQQVLNILTQLKHEGKKDLKTGCIDILILKSS